MRKLRKVGVALLLTVILCNCIGVSSALAAPKIKQPKKTVAELKKKTTKKNFTKTFDGATLCMGYSYKMGYTAYGKSVRKWKTVSNTSKAKKIVGTSKKPGDLKPGDVVRTTLGGGHTIFVTKVTTKTITFTDSNWGGRTRWGVKISRNTLRKKTVKVQQAPFPLWQTKKGFKKPDYNKYNLKVPASKKVKLKKNATVYYDVNSFNKKKTVKAGTVLKVAKVQYDYQTNVKYKLQDGTYVTASKSTSAPVGAAA